MRGARLEPGRAELNARTLMTLLCIGAFFVVVAFLACCGRQQLLDARLYPRAHGWLVRVRFRSVDAFMVHD